MKLYEKIKESIKDAIDNIMKGEELEFSREESIDLDPNSYITTIVVNIRNLSDLNKDKLNSIFQVNTINIVKEKNRKTKLPMGYRIDDKEIQITYITEKREDIFPCFDTAVTISTFIDLFNRLLIKNGLKEVEVGIGIASSERLERKYEGMKLKKREILSHEEIWIKAKRIALLGDVGREKRLNIAYVVYENILRKLIDEKGDRIRSEFDEKFNMKQGTYFATNIKDEEFQLAIKNNN